MKHQPVLLNEALTGLKVEPESWYIDATFGRGGHTSAILNQGGKVIALDVDQTAIDYGHQQLTSHIEKQNLILVRANFNHLDRAVDTAEKQSNISAISGVLFDFGTSTEQLTSIKRGFSFQGDGPLDMRMDDRLAVTAQDLLTVLTERQLTEIFRRYGGESQARPIAKAIVRKREQGQPVTTTQELVDVVTSIKHRRSNIHPATKIFQALRIAVNDELTAIEHGLVHALDIVASGGRIVTISFHEGEDRIAKHGFRAWEEDGQGEIITHKPIQPTDQELKDNPRARSAKLRIFEKK